CPLEVMPRGGVAVVIDAAYWADTVFFFFQAEDGIRVDLVLEFRRVLFRSQAGGDLRRGAASEIAASLTRVKMEAGRPPSASTKRSEERRVGKELRSRWDQDHDIKTRVTAETISGVTES